MRMKSSPSDPAMRPQLKDIIVLDLVATFSTPVTVLLISYDVQNICLWHNLPREDKHRGYHHSLRI